MSKQPLFETYEQVNESYYYNYEYYYFQAVRQLLPGNLDLRDVLVLGTIERLEKTKANTSTQIARNVTMSASAFSNYLRTLESELLVKRARGINNRKLMYVALTPRGKELNKTLKRFVQGYVKELVVRLGVIDSMKFMNVILAVSHDDESTPAPKMLRFNPQSAFRVITDALRNIKFIIYTQQEQSLATLNPPMTSREMRLLHGVMHLAKKGDVTPSDLGIYLGYPMSTMTSMLKGIETKQYIHRSSDESDLRKLLVTLDPLAEAPLEHFMSMRLKTIDGLLLRLKPNEQVLLERSFLILKEYSLKSINAASN